ncbi:hypothetical protein [Sphingomonas sp. SAFR-052]|uniref:hypothetical protein n=1 Tax=Sphingomonas sp. SAFR-052 TaxID=3436867 RepID=UPI003F7D3087
MNIQTAKRLAKSAGLMDVLEAAACLGYSEAVIDIFVSLGATVEDAKRLAGQMKCE